MVIKSVYWLCPSFSMMPSYPLKNRLYIEETKEAWKKKKIAYIHFWNTLLRMEVMRHVNHGPS